MPDYLIYGLRLRASAPLPALTPRHVPWEQVDIDVAFGSLPNWEPLLLERLRSRGEVFVERESEYSIWRFERDGRAYERWLYAGMRFVISAAGDQVWVEWDPAVAVEYAAIYLLGPVIGYVVHLRGMICLHASAIAVGGDALAVMGQAGAGKSTTSAALALLGYPIVSEDHLALVERDGAFEAQPGYPVVRLWPPSVRMLLGDERDLPRLVPGFEKRYLDLSGTPQFLERALPLRAVYWLAPRADAHDAPSLTALGPQDAALALLRNSYAGAVMDKRGRAAEFAALTGLAQRIRVCKVTPHTDPTRLPDLCRLILADFAAAV